MKIECTNGYLEYSVDDEEDNAYMIDIVEVINKRQGTGTELMKQFIKLADEEEKDITLCAYPQDGSITLENLVEFYENFGFEADYDDGKAVIMSRRQ